ncbi:DMT family transporter [Bradyrhizobium prioriisuperbiae]|uniref:DMT family transporter n=1 Tax=Bradyrhizobium prioriisuperbiae TaxID=2854389 RepID=UPI0028E8BCFF|nr:DMT family transporter [Bradyrhizobium prioritasuperba]
MTAPTPSSRSAIALFAFVVLAWGINWVVTKVIVGQVSPLWAMTIRTGIAVAVLAPALLITGKFVVPRRGDIPIVLVISLFHMVAFAALMAAGLKYVPVGRSIVLGYTTPLWVAPAAWMFLGEPMPPRRAAGVALGVAGLLLMFNPSAFDWRDQSALLGNGLLLLAALAWSVSILYTRVHRWISTPFQLVLWQALLATVVLAIMAVVFEGKPQVVWNAKLMVAFGFSGVIGTALAYWAMAVVNSHVSATTTSLGVLATPVVGITISAIFLGETIDAALVVSTAMILAGIAIGTTAGGSRVVAPALR